MALTRSMSELNTDFDASVEQSTVGGSDGSDPSLAWAVALAKGDSHCTDTVNTRTQSTAIALTCPRSGAHCTMQHHDLTIWTCALSSGAYGNVNLGEEEFNQMFRDSENNIARRDCSGCSGYYQVVFYKRLTGTESFNAYDYLANNWYSSNNQLNVHMQIFTSYSDALSGTNSWTFCNYDDGGVGFPRDCGRSSSDNSGGQWNSWAGRGGQGNIQWSIEPAGGGGEEEGGPQRAGLTTGSISMWLNGREVAKGSANENARIGTALDMTGTCVLGGSKWLNNYFPGHIDYVAFYDRKLDSEEMQKFTATPPPPPLSDEQCGAASKDQGLFVEPDAARKTIGSVDNIDDYQDIHLDATQETVYYIHTEIESNSESLGDTQMWVLDRYGNELAYNDNYPYADSITNRSRVAAPEFLVDETAEGGAGNTGCGLGLGCWSDGTVANAGSFAGMIHGPWGNNVRQVTRTIPVIDGISECIVSWRSWSIDSRDNEWDRVYLQGTEVWARLAHYNIRDMSDGQTNGNGWTKCGSPCTSTGFPIRWDGQATGYQDVSVNTDCSSGSLAVRFTSAIDQGLGNEGWAFSNFRVFLVGGGAEEAEEITEPYVSLDTERKSWSSMIVWRAPASEVFTIRVKSGLGGTPMTNRRLVNRQGLFRVGVATTEPVDFTTGIEREDLVVAQDYTLTLDTSCVTLTPLMPRLLASQALTRATTRRQVLVVNSLTILEGGVLKTVGAGALVIESRTCESLQ